MRTASRHTLRAVCTLLVGLALLALHPGAALASSTPWGASGAQYSGGLVCRLPDGLRVPMARWQVGGGAAFATADVIGTPTGDGPAPVGGQLAVQSPGGIGLDDHGAAVLAYLIGHYGSGSPTQVAEVSALVAQAVGRGAAQARCLGQQGTSTAAAGRLRAEAERLAGPYRVGVTTPRPGPPGSAAPITVTVLSASGAAVPGAPVTVAGAGQSVRVTTDDDGLAVARLSTPTAVSTPISVTTDQPDSLLVDAGSTPVAVTAAPGTPVVTGATLNADLHPRPALRVEVGGGLQAENSVLAPAAHVTGTYGFGGTGTLTLAGPAAPGRNGSCAGLSVSAFAAAPNAWSQPFSFSGDATIPLGTTPRLRAGCYVAGGTVTVTGVTPAATAAAPFEPSAVVQVIRLSVRRAAVPVLALPGKVSSAVTVDGADGATVANASTVFGPLVPRDGRCDGEPWSSAPTAGTVDATADPSVDGDARTAALDTPVLTRLGCYSLRTVTTIRQDGRTLTIRPDVGGAGSVVHVLQPAFSLADDRYDTTEGTPMTGQVTVSGTYRYAATVLVRLRSAAPRFDGCRSVSFPDVEASTGASAVTRARTAGDGTYTFQTPVPSANRCYALDATLQMADAPGVRLNARAVTPATLFLAGSPISVRSGPDVVHHPGSALRAGVGLLGSGVVMLAVAAAVIVVVLVRRRRVGATRPGDGELLVLYSVD